MEACHTSILASKVAIHAKRSCCRNFAEAETADETEREREMEVKQGTRIRCRDSCSVSCVSYLMLFKERK